MKRICAEGVGELMVNVVGSISEITASRFNDKTMLANYGHIENNLKTPQEILRGIETLEKEYKAVPGEEGLYLRGMLKGFQTFARMLDGEAISYKDCIKDMLQIDLHLIPDAKFEKLSNAVAEGLGKKGYKGQVGQMVQDYLKDTAIAPDEVTKTGMKYLDRAKAATLERVTRLPAEDGIDGVYGITNVFWSGYSRYIGDFRGDLTFNIERPWSLPTFANVLCHEGYPGHQTFYCHWDQLFREGTLPLEAAFYSTAGNPADPMFEGSPECGLHFLGWDDLEENTPEITDEEKIEFALGRDIQDLQRLYQQQASIMLNGEGETKENTVKYILSSGIYNQIEAENSVNFFGHPVQKYYYPSYYYGRWMIYEGYEAIKKEQRKEFFKFLYETPLTNETFIRGIAKMTGKEFDPFKDC